jgi:Transcriptional regulator
MKLIQLRYFQTACQYQSITRAAEILHISQPSISAAIKELETEFGVTLMVRQYRGFSLTPEGMELLRQSERLLEQADRVGEIMRDLGSQRHLIRLGIPPMIGSLLLPQIYQNYISHFPETHLRIYEAGRQDLLCQLAAGQLDMMFLPHNTPLDTEYNSLAIAQVETVFCTAADGPLADRSSIRIEDLLGEPLVLFQDGFYQNQVIQERFHSCGVTPNVILNSGQLSTVFSLIRSRSASGFLFRNVATQVPDIQVISLNPALTEQISLVWKKGEFLFSDMQQFIQHIQTIPFFDELER